MKVHLRNLPRVVIIGGGFGGLAAAQALKEVPVRITLLDRQNHHLFQPLLYQVATAALSPTDIAEPLRHILRSQGNAEVILTEVSGVDLKGKRVITSDGPVGYDHLIIAAGARHSYFGNPGWEVFAPGLKSLDDALEIRHRTLTAFEVAEKTESETVRAAALTFVVIGAGPTGVEMAGAIAEIARVTMVEDFRHIDSSQAKVILLDLSPRVLSTYSQDSSESALRQLRRAGVEVRLGVSVTALDTDGVTLKDGSRIPAKTMVWAAGNAASPLGQSLGLPLDRQGRVVVQRDLTLAGHPEVQVIGDQAHFETETGEVLPGLAPVASQQGKHAANNIRLQLAGSWTEKFSYFDKGSMATIGRHAAVAEANGIHMSGILAWFAWLFIHLIFLVSFRNKLMVLINWAYAYVTFGRHARLITGRPAAREPELERLRAAA